MTFAEPELTCDGFLGGALQILQPRQGYRAGTDPVYLAACVPAGSDAHVLELGCGVGVAALCLAHRTGAQVTGVELQHSYADLARRNAERAELPLHVIEADVATLPLDLRRQTFDHVMLNPPYFDPANSVPPEDAGKGTAFVEGVSLATWLDVALRRVRPKGTLTVIQRAERLADILCVLNGRCGNIRVLPLAARPGRIARRVIVQARTASAAPMQILPPLYIHVGAQHVSDGDDYAPVARAVLRQGRALDV